MVLHRQLFRIKKVIEEMISGKDQNLGKKYYIQTFGCQMNVRDSEQMEALLDGEGYYCTDKPDNADLIILNTCSIREKAAQKVYSELGRLSELKRTRGEVIIGISGCLAQEWGDRFFKKASCLDFVLGTHNINKLPALIMQLESTRRPVADTSFHKGEISSSHPSPKEGQVSAYVTIMRGCNNFCSYCVVPYLRGPEESRIPDEIREEVEILARQGIKEITLIGQNVNSYGNALDHKINFPDLIRGLSSTAGIERIRFTTSHPKDLSTELMDSFSKNDKLCNHIHLPVQSGSNRILAAMNRGYTREEYLAKLAFLRDRVPNISITSDVIVGFPDETEADFQDTIELMKEIRFDNLFSFKYSERPNTAAAKFANKVDEEIKNKRLQILQSLQQQHTREKHENLIGSQVKVLVEGYSRNSVEEVMGRTDSNKIVNFRGSAELIGKNVVVVITKAYQHSLHGELA